MDMYVCIGSSCHLKGSYDIITMLKTEIAERNLEEKVNLSASFCLGKCQKGVCVKVGDRLVTGWTPENTREMFEEHVVKGLGT